MRVPRAIEVLYSIVGALWTIEAVVKPKAQSRASMPNSLFMADRRSVSRMKKSQELNESYAYGRSIDQENASIKEQWNMLDISTELKVECLEKLFNIEESAV